MNMRIIRWCHARLQANEWIRRHWGESITDDRYVREILAARIYVSMQEHRELTVYRLAQEVAPEFISESTALRHIKTMVMQGAVEIVSQGRRHFVRLLPYGTELLETIASKYLETFEELGWTWRPDTARYFVLWADTKGVYIDATFTEFVGYPRDKLIGAQVGAIVLPDQRHLVRPQLKRTTERILAGELAVINAAVRHGVTGDPVRVAIHVTSGRDLSIREEYRLLNDDTKLFPSN